MTETIVAAIIAPAVLAAVALLVRLRVEVARLSDTVRRELSPNGGSSLHDRVVRIEARLEAQRVAQSPESRWDPPAGTPI